MRKTLLVLAVMLTVLSCSRKDKQDSLFVHCAAGMRKPVTEMADIFSKANNVNVQLNYDGSNRLLGQIKLTGKGDIYIAGDADYIDMAKEAGLTDGGKALCYFVPVIMLQKGNPLNVKQLSDLIKQDVRLGQADEKAAAVGRVTPEVLKLNGVDREEWNKKIVMETPTVNELGIAIKLKTIDAAVVWNAVASKYSDSSDIVTIDPAKNVTPAVSAAVLKFSKNSSLALKFLDYMVSEEGKKILGEEGYTVNKP